MSHDPNWRALYDCNGTFVAVVPFCSQVMFGWSSIPISDATQFAAQNSGNVDPRTLLTMDDIKMLRNQLLSDTDKYLVSDTPLSPTDLAAVKAYRTALRALPDTYSTVASVVWPPVPTISVNPQPTS